MDETEYERLLGAAIRFVSFRPRSEKELRDFCAKTLKRHHTTAPLVIDQVMSRLTELEYVNDRTFVEWWVGQRTAFRPKGKRIIMSELGAKGVAKPVVDEYFAAMGDNRDEKALAQQAAEKKLALWHALPPLTRKQKLYDFLSRRGFDSDTVGSVVDDVMGKE